mgnify:CR=1 FL=1
MRTERFRRCLEFAARAFLEQALDTLFSGKVGPDNLAGLARELGCAHQNVVTVRPTYARVFQIATLFGLTCDRMMPADWELFSLAVSDYCTSLGYSPDDDEVESACRALFREDTCYFVMAIFERAHATAAS